MSAEEIEMFIAVTCASAEDAQTFVEGTEGNVEQAIQIFFEVGGDVKKASWEFFGGRKRYEEEERKRAEEERLRAEEEERLRREAEAEEMRRSEEELAKAEIAALGRTWEDRVKRITLHLLSSAVQMEAAEGVQEIAAKLTPDEVASVFKRYVPGVEEFLYRGQDGTYSLSFMQSAYVDGLQAFQNTPVHNHLLWLLRLIVHCGEEGRPGVEILVRQVAEAFMDCQAVQARVIEHAGLQLAGLALDFHGLVIRIIAVKTLAYSQHRDDDEDPAHYENRLTADLGDALGLNKNSIKQAELDEHAKSRFSRLGSEEVRSFARRARQLFDFEAMLHAFVAEVNSFNAESPPDSLPCLFLQWANAHLTQQHVVFDEDTCSYVDVGDTLALAILELLFLGKVYAPADELYRGEALISCFPCEAAAEEPASETAPVASTLQEFYLVEPWYLGWM